MKKSADKKIQTPIITAYKCCNLGSVFLLEFKKWIYSIKYIPDYGKKKCGKNRLRPCGISAVDGSLDNGTKNYKYTDKDEDGCR